MNKKVEHGHEKQEIDANKHQKKQEAGTEDKKITLSEQEYTHLKQEAEKSKEYHERILRLQADFENIRKRIEREKNEFVRFANEGLVVDLLNVVDDLERTLELAQEKHEDFSAFLKGVEMILAHLYDLLKKHGLSPIESKGRVFDPGFHEALLNIETDAFPENTVVEELQKGYLLNGRLIRTAKVKVAKKEEDKGNKEDEGK